MSFETLRQKLRHGLKESPRARLALKVLLVAALVLFCWLVLEYRGMLYRIVYTLS